MFSRYPYRTTGARRRPPARIPWPPLPREEPDWDVPITVGTVRSAVRQMEELQQRVAAECALVVGLELIEPVWRALWFQAAEVAPDEQQREDYEEGAGLLDQMIEALHGPFLVGPSIPLGLPDDEDVRHMTRRGFGWADTDVRLWGHLIVPPPGALVVTTARWLQHAFSDALHGRYGETVVAMATAIANLGYQIREEWVRDVPRFSFVSVPDPALRFYEHWWGCVIRRLAFRGGATAPIT